MSQEEAWDQRQEDASSPVTSAQRLKRLSADPLLRSIVAANPAAPTQVLKRLAQDEDEQVRQAVASNPNTPWQTLEQLAVEFPHQFLNNPVGPLHLLTHPEQVSTKEEFWGTLLREEAIPSWWCWLRSHSVLGESCAVRLHIQCAGETAHFYGVPKAGEEHLLLTLVELLTAACVQGASVPTLTCASQSETEREQIVREHLQWLAHCVDGRVKTAVANNPQTPVEVLQFLAQDQEWGVQWAVAENEQTPVEVLQFLAQDEDGEVRRTVAENEHTPAEVLQFLAQDQDTFVRRAVAGDAQTPVVVLHTLAQDQESWVRVAVAKNEHTPAEMLRTLAQDKYVHVRIAVASNKHTPVEALRTLAQDEDGEVREAVAWNKHTPTEVLATLTQDCEEEVRWVVSLVKRLLAEGGERWREQHWWQLPLIEIRASEWSSAIGKVSIEEQLGKVAQLVEVPDAVRQIIVATLATGWDSTKIQTAFAVDGEGDGIKILCDKREHYQYILAPFMPPIALQKLAASPSWEVRYLVALHARTPREIRQHLSQDGNRYVRATARAKAEMIDGTARQ